MEGFGTPTSLNMQRGGQLKKKQDCFLQKEARVCVSIAFVIEDSRFKWCFFVVEAEQVAEETDMLMWI